MKKEWLVKTLALGVVVLFVGVCFQPILAENTISVEKDSDYSNVDFEDAKEYLFQTLVDISNNPKVKVFLNEHKQDLITNDYDCKNAFQKIWLQKPKQLISMLFTKPEMTNEYLETNYNRGLEVAGILGEVESSKIIESINIANPELSNGLKNILLNDEELTNRISNLKEINNNLISIMNFSDHPIICLILAITFLPIIDTLWILPFIVKLFHNNPLISLILSIIAISIAIISFPLLALFVIFGCGH